MTGIEQFLADKGIYFLTFFLLSLGIYGIITCKNYMKKLIGMNIMQVSAIIFFLSLGQKKGATIPVLLEGLTNSDAYNNPLTHALMLTAIVVSLGTTGVGLALLTRIKEKFGSVEEEEIIRRQDKL
ncbi:MAG: cation:proton antiporter subunit C [Clostridiales bacterium]|nr:cation:proton antiporter subunit C [Clostridiales bacterium]